MERGRGRGMQLAPVRSHPADSPVNSNAATQISTPPATAVPTIGLQEERVYSNGRSHDGDWHWLRGCAAWPFCGPDNFPCYGRLKSPFAKAL